MAIEPVGVVNRIKQIATQVLKQSPQGIRFSELVSSVRREFPEAETNTVKTVVADLSRTDPSVVRPSRGLYILSEFSNGETRQPLEAEVPRQTGEISQQTVLEADYYEPFASWLQTVEEEVNEGIVVGGNSFRNKWATPDVIGTYKPQPADPVKFPLELVSAEIKIDPGQSVTAFGQACAYRLFSHKVYIVMPNTIEAVKDDLERLQALCTLFGMGLVLFKLDRNDPQFEKRVAARKFEPDMFYVNEFARRLQQTDQSTFNKLF